MSRDWNLQVEWKPQDCWIGLFWRRDGNCLDVWLCLLPMLPLHFSCWGARWGMHEAALEEFDAH